MVSPFVICVDTREQKPYTFSGIESVDETMETGDYSIVGFKDRFSVERKSLGDFISSITKPERERFKREIKRGIDLDEFRVIIEASREDVESEDYWSDIHPNAVLGTADGWQNSYGIPFEFAGSREGAMNRTVQLLSGWWSEYQ